MGSFNVNPTTILSKIHVRTPTQAESLSSRYTFLNLNNAEPNLGRPPEAVTGGTYYSSLTSSELLGIRYALLSNNHSGSAWRVWAYDNPKIATYSKEGSIGLGDNAFPINIKSFVYSNYAYDNQNNRYNSQSFSNKTFNVFALSGIYLFDSTTIGDPASAIAFIVTDQGKVGIGTENPPATLSIIGTISGSNFTTSFNSGSATGERSFAVNEGIASGPYSHAEGGSSALGSVSHAEGTGCIASGDSSHAEGEGTEASGDYSHAEGQGSNAIGSASHAEGGSTASGTGSHAEGDATEASGYASHAEGTNCIASGDSSHAEGYQTEASGYNSHAEGYLTEASGYNSHAEGDSTIASGDTSHAEGEETIASGMNSHAAGRWAQAAHDRTWIWKGNTGVGLLSTTRTDQFMVSAAGGIFFPGAVGIGTDSIANALTVKGAISASQGITVGTRTSLPGISAATLVHATTALTLSITDIFLKINISGTDYALPLYNYTI
jgi:hypothetical protein